MQAVTQNALQAREQDKRRSVASKMRSGKYQRSRPANDVNFEVNCPAGALTFYQFKPQPFLIDEKVTAELLDDVNNTFEKNILDQLSTRLGLIKDFHHSGLLSDDVMSEGIEALKAGDSEALSGWVSGVFKIAKECLLQKVMNEVQALVTGLPFGAQLWEQLSECEFYGFFINESSDGAELRYSALDFFRHFDIDAESLSQSAMNAYLMVITKLIFFGDGAWQQDVCSYGRWEFVIPKSQEELDVVTGFVNEIQSIEVSEASAFLQGYTDKAVIDFIATVEESYYLELSEIIEADDEENFDSAKESMTSALDYLKAEFGCNKLGITGHYLDWSEIEALIKNIETPHQDTVILLKAIVAHSPLFSESEDDRKATHEVLCAVEETHPGFGIVLSPFKDGTVEGEALNSISEEMENQFMETGEFEDAWIIDTSNPSWVEVILQRTKATALLMSLVIGHAVVLKPQL